MKNKEIIENIIEKLTNAHANAGHITNEELSAKLIEKITAALKEAEEAKTKIEEEPEPEIIEPQIPTYTRGEPAREVIPGIKFSTVSGGVQVQFENVSGTEIVYTDPATNIIRTMYGANYRILNNDVKRLIFIVRGVTTEVKIVQ